MTPKWLLREQELKSLGLGHGEDPLAEEGLRESLSILLPTKSTAIGNFTRKYEIKSEKHQILEFIKLPGQGHGYQNCGKKIWMKCNNKNHDELAKGKSNMFRGAVSCNCRGCPEDWDKWAWKTAHEDSCRLWMGARVLKRLHKARWFRIHHAQVSFKVAPGDTKKYIDWLTRNILKRHGFVGGNQVFHPNKKNTVTGEYDIQDGTYHEHVLAVALGKWSMSKKGQCYNGREYVFKVNPDPCTNPRHRRKFFKTHDRCDCQKHYTGVKRFDDIQKIMHYELTHAGYIGLGKAVKWWGELACNMLPKAKIRESNPQGWDYYHRRRGVPCPYCGSMETSPDWDKILWGGDKPPPIDKG